jgi:hypothetical protein
MPARRFLLLPLILMIVFQGFVHPSDAQTASKKDAILKAAEITPKIFPDKVFYRGQVATVQMRNTAAIHYGDDPYVLVALVDTAGYATGLREKYQAYFLTEVPLELNGQALKPGAYGVGFVSGSKFMVTDVGANDVLQAAGARDIELKHPIPLQIVAAPEAGSYRLYLGRDYITLKRTR